MSNTVTGARAVVYVDEKLVGIFDSCSISENFGTEGIHILGRYTASEIVIHSKEVVNISCSGFRVVGQGKHVLPKVPRVKDLLGFTPFVMVIKDRQTGLAIETISDCTPNSSSVNYNAKASSKVQISYQGIINGDESASADAEITTGDKAAADLPLTTTP